MEKNFCLCCDDKFVPFAAVTIHSVLKSMNDGDNVHIHIITQGLAQKNYDYLKSLGSCIKIYELSNHELMKDLETTSEWSLATWLRIFIVDILDEKVNRVLYLDCDVIVNDNLDDLFTLDMNNISIAGCVDVQTYDPDTFIRLNYPKEYGYVCAGVLMLNLDYWREHRLKYKILEYGTVNTLKFLDQDAINYICHSSKIILDPEYGVLVPYFINRDFINAYKKDINRLFYQPKIIHFAGYSPWIYAKNRAGHAKIWWQVFDSLRAFPEVRKKYLISKLKWWVRLALSKCGIIGRKNRYTIYQYYYHPRITEKTICKIMNS